MFYSLLIYRFRNARGQEVILPGNEIEKSVAEEKGYKLIKEFHGLSAMACSTLYNTAMRLRWSLDEKSLVAKLGEMAC